MSNLGFYTGNRTPRRCVECPKRFPPHLPGLCALAEFVASSRRKLPPYVRENTRRVSDDANSPESMKFKRRP